MKEKKQIDVAIGIIKKGQQVLLAWRDAKKHQGGCYEFSGGKVEKDETPQHALQRELNEELGIDIIQPLKFTRISHDYGDIFVVLHVFLVEKYSGEPRGAEAQTIQWINVSELQNLPFPAANVPIVRMATWQPSYFITHSMASFQKEKGNTTHKIVDQNSIQNDWLDFYCEKLPKHAQCYVRDRDIEQETYLSLVTILLSRRPDLFVFVHAEYLMHSTDITEQLSDLPIAGMHLSHQTLNEVSTLPKERNLLVMAACHDQVSITQANRLEVDAITLSPVQRTTSHSKATPLGWQNLSHLASLANQPVFALGGLSHTDMPNIRDAGCYGVAGIRGLL